MPRILLPNGATRFVSTLNPGDVLASGEKSILERAGVDAGQDATQMSTAGVINTGADESAPAVAAVPGIFSPKFRRFTQPSFAPAAEVPRRTTRLSY